MADVDATGPLAAFVTARLDEEQRLAEEAARKASPRYDVDGTHWRASGEGIYCEELALAVGAYGYLDDEVAEHIGRHDPARVLADLAAKRKRLALYLEAKAVLEGILKGFRAEETPANFHMHAAQRQKREQAAGRFIAFQTSVKLDAMTWAKHGGFRPEWKVEG